MNHRLDMSARYLGKAERKGAVGCKKQKIQHRRDSDNPLYGDGGIIEIQAIINSRENNGSPNAAPALGRH